MPNTSEELMTIGKITRHQGNKGEVRILPLTDFPERFEELDQVYLVKNRIQKEVTIEDVWYHKKFIILKFEEFNDIGQAIKHQNFFVKISKTDTIDLDENSFFLYDIMGLEVYTIDNEYLGKVDDILETGANDVYVIKKENNELLIPAITEVVIDINLEDNKMIVKLLPGLR